MGEPPLGDYYLAAFLAGFALPSYSSGMVIVYKKKVKLLYVRCLQLDIAVVKATNHVERPAKEKYIRDIFMHLNSGRARADVAYCIRSLARRLSKTRNWVISLKMLIVIHRALREVDPSFRDELISYGRSSGQMLHMSYFKDDSSHDGILEPIKAGITDAKLGVGKQEQDDFFTTSANFCIFF
ncbi:putative clathrin assembly protein [Hordeum vulgare]|nr:putative clathrin assembly protein [Hordeum vulgare]